MSPPAGSPVDPTELAIGLAQVRADQSILQREVASSIQNLSSATDAVQAELRHIGSKLEDVARLQQQQANHSEGLDRAFKSIEKLANSFDSWRERHEGENRTTADCVTEFRGQFRGVWMAGGLVVALVTALATVAGTRINERFSDVEKWFADAKAERVAVEARRQAAHDKDVADLQKQITELQSQNQQLQATRGAR